MKKLLLISTLLMGFSFFLHAQRSKVISVFQLVETGKFEEAKEAIEEAVGEDKTSHWYMTWYARGYLAQKAYEKGIKDNDKKKYELYPDQLYVAHKSYKRSLNLDTRRRINDDIAPLYVSLANDFQQFARNKYKSQKYDEALKAFEHALEITQSPLLSVKTDTSLIYNTALAAYQAKNKEKADEYLSKLDELGYSPNVSYLLFNMKLETGDTASAREVLTTSMNKYKDNHKVVLLLVDLLYKNNNVDEAIAVLDSAEERSPENYIYPFTKGLVYQKNEQYQKAITSYKKALKLNEDEIKIYTRIGTCYYNIGVDIQEKARAITNNTRFRQEQAKSAAAFQSAAEWLKKAQEKNPENEEINSKLYRIRKFLDVEG